MNTRKTLFATLLLCFGGLAAYGQSSPIVAEIRPAQASVKNNEDFSVSTSLRNTSNSEQSLEVLYCGYSVQWVTDNPSVHVDFAEGGCMHNFPHKTVLKPGEAYERALSVHVELASGNGQLESVTFRLGFQDENTPTVPTVPRIWSNAVTVSVRR